MPGRIDPKISAIMVPGVGTFSVGEFEYYPPNTAGRDGSDLVQYMQFMGYYWIPGKKMQVPVSAAYLIMTN